MTGTAEVTGPFSGLHRTGSRFNSRSCTHHCRCHLAQPLEHPEARRERSHVWQRPSRTQLDCSERDARR